MPPMPPLDLSGGGKPDPEAVERAAMERAEAQRNAAIDKIGRDATRSVYWLLLKFLILGLCVYWFCKS